MPNASHPVRRPRLGGDYSATVSDHEGQFFWARFVKNNGTAVTIGDLTEAAEARNAAQHAEQKFLTDNSPLPALPAHTVRIELDLKTPPCERSAGPLAANSCCVKIAKKWTDAYPATPIYLFVREVDNTENLVDTFAAPGQFRTGWRAVVKVTAAQGVPPGARVEGVASQFRMYQIAHAKWRYWTWTDGDWEANGLP
ncbi:MAG: hypothetical protein JO040_13405 [Gemmatimonadetes bacterium]|nr:hypothetical protein [Gemmatimonadota bacterium]